MAGFQCPYCSMVMPITSDTTSTQYPCFKAADGILNQRGLCVDSCIAVTFYKCPNCFKYTVQAFGKENHFKDLSVKIIPRSSAKKFPNYIPALIREDYEEACSIMDLSPKASATLARRCLQGMIRDYWGISDKTLYLEINALKDKIQLDLWNSIDALRQIGNIGAHMEMDTNLIVEIDANEANSLIQLIELLMKEWYIAREERNNLFANIQGINHKKQITRKNQN